MTSCGFGVVWDTIFTDIFGIVDRFHRQGGTSFLNDPPMVFVYFESFGRPGRHHIGEQKQVRETSGISKGKRYGPGLIFPDFGSHF